jgi:hypothetical protein
MPLDRRRLLLAAPALLSAPLLRAQSARPKHRIGWLAGASLRTHKLNIDAFKGRSRRSATLKAGTTRSSFAPPTASSIACRRSRASWWRSSQRSS